MSLLSFVQIRGSECILSTEDAIGFIRPHGRISEKLQRAALTEDGVKGIVDDRSAIERMACHGRVFKVRHLFLFADPKARKRGGWRKDLMAFMGRVEDKGAIIKDVDLQLTTEKPSHRSAMLLQAIEQLASNGRTVHLKGKRTGRKATAFDAAALRDAKSAWRNVKDYPTWEAVAKALPEGFTTARAYKFFGKRF